jgi:hypothetical protein
MRARVTIRTRIGDQSSGLVAYELYVHEKTMEFPGIDILHPLAPAALVHAERFGNNRLRAPRTSF